MDIPGLNIEDIVNNIIKVKHGEMLSEITDEEERKKKTQELVNYYSSGDSLASMQDKMDSISNGVELLNNIIIQLQTAVTTVLIPPTVPQVLVVGQATGAPNPSWLKVFTAAIKPSLLVGCESAEYIYQQIIISCNSIGFEPPSVVTAVENQIKAIKQQINAL